MIKDAKLFPVIFLCSCASLGLEVALTRIFSISLWYHFAFMIISIAMLGYAASGTVLSIYPRLKEISNISGYALLFGVGISLSYLLANRIPFDPVRLAWEKAQLLYVALYYLVLAFPFFCAGLVIATAFSAVSEKSGLLYGADLLGAGAGSLGILGLMWAMAPDRTVFLLSSLVLAAACMVGSRRVKALSILLIALNLALIFLKPGFAEPRISPYKGLQSALKYPGAEPLKTYYTPFARIDTFRSPAVRFAPGLSLRYLEPLPEQIGLAVDGGETSAVTGTADRNALRFLGHLPSALPYEIGKRSAVLLLDPGGGLPVLMARRYGTAVIAGVESNPDLVRVIRDDFRTFSGHIYGEDTWTGLGRSWLRAGERKFDLIDISMLGAEPAHAFGIGEEYRFTVEAFKEYLGHLRPDGLLSVNLYILPPPRIELRLLNTVVAAMEEFGVRDAASRVVAVRSWGSLCMLVKNSPFTAGEVEAVRRFARERRFDLVYCPGIREEESNVYVRMPSNEYFSAFKGILDPERREGFAQGYVFDIRPVYDDRPFFHYFLRLGNIRDIYRVMGGKWEYFMEEGYILPAVFLQVLLLSGALVLLPALAGRKESAGRRPPGRDLLPYFAFLGVGYMFVEIALIQKSILPLEHPSHAVAAVLTSLLVSSGIGSLLSYRFSSLRSPFVSFAVSLLVIAYSVLLPPLSGLIAPHALPVKIVLLFLLLLPLGLPMGIPFPTGLKLLGERNPSLIPWAWVINGAFSVLAPLLTIMAAMAIGFRGVLLLGALAYFLAFLNLRSGTRD